MPSRVQNIGPMEFCTVHVDSPLVGSAVITMYSVKHFAKHFNLRFGVLKPLSCVYIIVAMAIHDQREHGQRVVMSKILLGSFHKNVRT